MLNSYRLQQADGMVVAQVIFNRSKSESYYVLLKPSIKWWLKSNQSCCRWKAAKAKQLTEE